MWVQAGETWKTVLLGLGAAALLAAGGWAWRRWKASRTRVFDPLSHQGEGISRIAFDAEIRVVAVLPGSTGSAACGGTAATGCGGLPPLR